MSNRESRNYVEVEIYAKLTEGRVVCEVRCERRYINLVTGDYVNTCDAVGCKC